MQNLSRYLWVVTQCSDVTSQPRRPWFESSSRWIRQISQSLHNL